jgi:hypothetical protein
MQPSLALAMEGARARFLEPAGSDGRYQIGRRGEGFRAGMLHGLVTAASGLSAAWTSSSLGHQSGRSISVTRSRMIFCGIRIL